MKTASGVAPPPAGLLAEFAVSEPEFLAETPIATLWRVTRACGGLAVLKDFKGGEMGGEAAGFAYLRLAPQARAAEAYAVSARAALIEWLPGPSLGDIARGEDLLRADSQLLETALALHAGTGAPVAPFPPLEARFGALLAFQPDVLPLGPLRRGLEHGRSLSLDLLEHQGDPCALHGDLHHENVRQGARGFCAFDAKGLWGEPAYELANAFRHPTGSGYLLDDPELIRRRAGQWSAGLGCSASRLLAWAAAKCALSIAWRLGETGKSDPETGLLTALLRAHSERI